MATVFAPQGFKLDKHDTGMARQNQIDNLLPSGFSTHNFYRGMPVKLNNVGNIEPVSAADDIIFGIFNGIEYVDGNSQRPVNQSYYIANSPILANAFLAADTGTVTRVYLYTSPDTVYQLQFTSVLSKSPTGSQFNLNATVQTVTQADGSIFPFAGNTTPLLISGTAPYGGYSWACVSPTFVEPAFTGQLVCQGLETGVFYGGNAYDTGFPVAKFIVNSAAMKAAVVQPDYPPAA